MGESPEMADDTQGEGMRKPDSNHLTPTALHPESADRWPAPASVIYDYPEPHRRLRKQPLPWRVTAGLRANHSPPTEFVAPQDFPNRTLHGEAIDLAEILNANLAPAYSARPWPVWLQAFDNYVAALRAISFVETNPTPQPVRDGIDNLYQHSIVEPLRICPITDR